MKILNEIIDNRMIGILRGYDTEDATKIAEVLIEKQINVLEIALNSPNAKTTIKSLKEKFNEDIFLGAGTVLNVKDADDCINAGAEFLLSPIYNEEVLQFAAQKNILYIPGCYTPTEIYKAHESGARMIKVFPAGQLKPQYIKELLAPMNDLVLLPTGGVTQDNINEFLDSGAKAVGISSAILPPNSKVGDEFLEDVRYKAEGFKEALKIED